MSPPPSASLAFARRIRPDSRFDLAQEVADTYRAFPELRGNTYFINAATGRLIHPNATGRMRKRVLKNGEVRMIVKQCREGRRSQFYRTDEKNLNIVALYLEPDGASLDGYPKNYSLDHIRRTIFDHELGHALTLRTAREHDKYCRSSLLMETMADSFSLIRQFQRYGTHSRAIRAGELIAMSASYFVFGDEDNQQYFTAPAMKKLAGLSRKFNFASLSPQETVQVARGVALKTTPPASAAAAMKEELPRHPGRDIMEAMSVRLLTTKSREAFRWGNIAIRYCMGTEFIQSGPVARFKKKMWPKVEKALSERKRAGFPRAA